MQSLRAVLAECGVLSKLPHALSDLDISNKKIIKLQEDIALLVRDALVDRGYEVAEDFQPEKVKQTMKLFEYSRQTKNWLEVEAFQSLDDNCLRVHSTRHSDQPFGLWLIREGLYSPRMMGNLYMTEVVMREYLVYEELKRAGLSLPCFTDSDFKDQFKKEFSAIYDNLAILLQL